MVNKQVTTTLADGTPIPGGFTAQSDPPYYPTVTSGLQIASFTNETTGKTIVRNVSGPNWFTYDAAPQLPGALATGTYVTTGTNSQLFGPMSEAALQAAGIVELALADDGAAVSAGEAAERRLALRSLGTAARQALVAACSPEVWPPG